LIIKTLSLPLVAILFAIKSADCAGLSPIYQGEKDLFWQAYKDGKYVSACDGWKQLARKKDTVAEFNYGYCLEEGLHAKARPAEASIWYGRAAEAGLAQAQHNLALLRISGDNIRQDIILGYFWLIISSRTLGSSKKALTNLIREAKLTNQQQLKLSQLLQAYDYNMSRKK
tara:strand:- start:387 stop:899 length:513 start_codon:yes stop_codon:yes gene_type:complete